MIIVTVELQSARTGKTEILGKMHISNDGTGSDAVAHYDGRILRKPAFDTITKLGKVMNYRRHNHTIWVLVARMLKTMGYAG